MECNWWNVLTCHVPSKNALTVSENLSSGFGKNPDARYKAITLDRYVIRDHWGPSTANVMKLPKNRAGLRFFATTQGPNYSAQVVQSALCEDNVRGGTQNSSEYLGYQYRQTL